MSGAGAGLCGRSAAKALAEQRAVVARAATSIRFTFHLLEFELPKLYPIVRLADLASPSR